MSKLKLEVGKSYKNRKGDIEKITDFLIWKDQPLIGASGGIYKVNGTSFDGKGDVYDLVEEIEEETNCYVSRGYSSTTSKMTTNVTDDSPAKYEVKYIPTEPESSILRQATKNIEWRPEGLIDESSALHQKICYELGKTFRDKNHDYGNSFEQSLNSHGLLASLIRVEDKINRFKSLINKDAKVNESIRDTIMDCANYLIMTAMWLDKNKTYEK